MSKTNITKLRVLKVEKIVGEKHTVDLQVEVADIPNEPLPTEAIAFSKEIELDSAWLRWFKSLCGSSFTPAKKGVAIEKEGSQKPHDAIQPPPPVNKIK